MIEWLLRQRLVRFLLVGGSATLLQFLLLALLVEWLSVYPVFASAAAYSLSAMFNYWLNYHFTFTSRSRHWRTLPKFVLVALIGLTVNTGCFALLAIFFHYIPAQVVATGVTLVNNFILHQYWIYRRTE